MLLAVFSAILAMALAAPQYATAKSILQCRYGIESASLNATTEAECLGMCTRVSTVFNEKKMTMYGCYDQSVCRALELDNSCASTSPSTVVCCCDFDDCNGLGESKAPPTLSPSTNTIECLQGVFVNGSELGYISPTFCPGNCVRIHLDSGLSSLPTDVLTCDMTSVCQQLHISNGCQLFDGGYGCCCDSSTGVECPEYTTGTTTLRTSTMTPSTTKARTCPSEWTYFSLTNKCYKVYFSEDYETGWWDCIGKGGFITSIHSAAENSFVADLTETHLNATAVNQMTLIGMNYNTETGKWTWDDTTEVDYIRWGPKEPKTRTSMTCVLISQDSPNRSWYTDDCNTVDRAMVCSKDANN